MKTYNYTEKKDTRSGFGAGLAELGRKNPNVVALCADLVGSLKMNQFIDENPELFFQVGIADAKSRTGKGKPVCILLHTEMGNGVDFMMGTHAWHGKAPNDEQLASALAQNKETLGDY